MTAGLCASARCAQKTAVVAARNGWLGFIPSRKAYVVPTEFLLVIVRFVFTGRDIAVAPGEYKKDNAALGVERRVGFIEWCVFRKTL